MNSRMAVNDARGKPGPYGRAAVYEAAARAEAVFETALAAERPRLVRLCARYTDDPQTAEDLAQETLLAAWKRREQLRAPEKLGAWLSAIARNLCFAWLARRRREQTRQVSPDEAGSEAIDEALPDAAADLELALDRSELAALLDRALALLPPETAHLLVEHYIKESPHAEIAERMGLKAGTVAVRLQRGKLSLQRLLRAEAAALGLQPAGGGQWQATHIWCPSCGQARLLGRFEHAAGSFALRCPRCSAGADKITAGLDLSIPYNARLLGSTRMYKPAYARLQTAVAGYFREAVAGVSAGDETEAACPVCRRPVAIRVTYAPGVQAPQNEGCSLSAACEACGWRSNTTLWGLVLALPEAQRFWREHPRLRKLPVQAVEAQGGAAYITRLQSVTGAAELVVVSRRGTFEPLGVHSNITL